MDAKRQERMLYSQPYERWPQIAVAMNWQRPDDPPWLEPDDRLWFWRMVDAEIQRAAKQAEWDAAVAALKAAVLAPFVPIVDWLAKHLPK